MEKEVIQQVENKVQINFSIRQSGKIYFVSVENIAFVYVEHEMVFLVDFDGIKHPMSKTLEFLENAVSSQQFYRINRKMIINRKAIKGVENYSNQRIIVHLTLSTPENAIVPRAKIKPFLNWIEKG
jgi:two-component system, LytTR family, response regulator LytT